MLVFEAVREYGLPALGVIVLAAGLLQLAMGALKLGRWFRAISVAVVEGMLAGIGLVLIAGQLYAVAGLKAPAAGLDKITGLPEAARRSRGEHQRAGLAGRRRRHDRRDRALEAAAQEGAGGAGRARRGRRWRPLVTLVFDLPVGDRRGEGPAGRRSSCPGSSAFGELASLSVLGTVVAFTLIASAESLFSAAAVDRLHDGPRTEYDKELMAQGAGNTVCGLLGALPMTAVIVRSSANVQAGARTKASRVMHGVWLLLFAALLPGALALIPLPALAGILVHAGWKLIPLRGIVVAVARAPGRGADPGGHRRRDRRR